MIGILMQHGENIPLLLASTLWLGENHMNNNTVSADFTFYVSNVFYTLTLAPSFMLLPSLPHAFPFFHLFLTPFDLSAQWLVACLAHFSA